MGLRIRSRRLEMAGKDETDDFSMNNVQRARVMIGCRGNGGSGEIRLGGFL